MDKRARQEQVRLSWSEIVGDVIARVSSVERIADGVAYVGCMTPVWAQTLSLRRNEILAKIGEHAGSSAIREVRFSSVSHSIESKKQSQSAAAQTGGHKPRPKPLTPSQEETIAAIAASLREKGSPQRAPATKLRRSANRGASPRRESAALARARRAAGR